MSNLITLDFESFYSKDYSLTKITTEEYIRHADFEVIGLSIKHGDEPATWFSGTRQETQELLNAIDWKDKILLSHNTQFDGAILAWRFGHRPKAYFDTMSMSRAIDGVDVSHSLAKCVERHGLGAKGDEVIRAIGKRRADFFPSELAEYGKYCTNDTELCYKLFNQLAQGFPTSELKLIDLTLQMFINSQLAINQSALQASLQTIKERKAQAVQRIEAKCKELGYNENLPDILRSRTKFAHLLQAYGVTAPTKVSPTTGKPTLALAKTDPELIALQEHDDENVRALIEARLQVQSSIEETRTQRLIDIGSRGNLPVSLKYFGARTGRWSADGATNMQNLPRESLIKQGIEAPAGYALIGADLSNIELRVGLWIAGQFDKLNLLGKGGDLYKDFIARVLGKDINEVTKEERQIGKTAVLSLLYGTGAVKLRKTLTQQTKTDPGQEACEGMVAAYRDTYSDVRSVWYQANDAIEAIHADQTFAFGYNDFGKVSGKRGVRLPSGLYMAYNGLHQQTDADGKTGWYYQTRQGQDKLYGAKVFQGLTQATARCVMSDQMLTLKKKYRIVLTIHDAVYLIAPEHEADAVLQDVLQTMSTMPPSMPGLHLAAEGACGKTLYDL